MQWVQLGWRTLTCRSSRKNWRAQNDAVMWAAGGGGWRFERRGVEGAFLMAECRLWGAAFCRLLLEPKFQWDKQKIAFYAHKQPIARSPHFTQKDLVVCVSIRAITCIIYWYLRTFAEFAAFGGCIWGVFRRRKRGITTPLPNFHRA